MHHIDNTSSSLIFTVKCDLVSLALKNGSPLGRWKRSVSVMLQKVPGNYEVEKYENCNF